jgi:glycosyltransferase involved in cell wall biosynthesis
MAILEYGLHKKPVVVTAVGELPMVIQNGKNGFLILANQEQLFYEAVMKLIENDAMRIDFGKTLYKTVLENYSEEILQKKYLDWLQTV